MNKSTLKVSVVMSVYNGSDYLRKSIESILNQTFNDFELIVINDCSTDNTEQIIKEYIDKGEPITLINNSENLGLTKSLNKGFKVATGEYIARQDADDISLLNRLQLQVDFLDTHPEVGALGSSVEFIDERDLVLSQQKLPVDHESLKALLLLGNCLWHSSMTIRRSLLQKIGGYNEDILQAQDYDLWWRLSRISRLATLPDILIRYRTNNVSAITKQKRKQQLQCGQKISLRAIQECLGEKTFNLDDRAYERFWWATRRLSDRQAYQQLWLSQHGKQARLQRKDIQKLQPFWTLLANFPKASQIWSPRLRKLAYILILERQFFEGLQLLWVVVSQLSFLSLKQGFFPLRRTTT